ncbi:MAG: Alpha-2,3-sialyltransferase [Rhodocyclales bacterium]|nr:Alpha-2,3-sialyltransferase [Rhodocyclales bacterium]
MSTRDLCLCLTPLHALIAGQISRKLGKGFDVGMYVTNVDNAKHRHYAEKMRAYCTCVEYIVTPSEDSYAKPRHLSILLRRLNYRLRWAKLGTFSAVYVPSSLNHYTYILLSSIGLARISTYDDGMLNIQSDSQLLSARTSLSAKIFLRMAGVRFWAEKLMERSAQHFTIYAAKNVFARTVQIGLFDDSADFSAADGKDFRLLVGAAPEASPAVWSELQSFVEEAAPDVYLPHPREVEPKLKGVAYLETPLIAEDYISGKLVADPALKIKIFGYESSILVNLAGVPRVESFSLMPDNKDCSEARSLMKRCGVSLVHGQGLSTEL